MKSETVQQLSDKRLIEAREGHMQRLGDVFAGKDNEETAFVLCGIAVGWLPRGITPGVDDPAEFFEEMLDELAGKAEAMADRSVFRPLGVEMSIYGVHFVDSLFGAEVFDIEGNWQVHTLTPPIGSLARPNLEERLAWKTARQIAAVLCGSGVTAPFFGLPTIASAINVGVNLYGGELLVEMLANPDAAAHDLKVINDLLCDLHRWYLAHMPPAQIQPVVAAWRTQPAGFGQICGCSTQLLSPELYRDMVAPLDDAVLRTWLNGGMIHLCGQHTQHIPVWRAMASLRSVQLNDRAAEDLELYYKGLRDDQILYVNPSKGMPVERIMEITGGDRTVIVANVQPPRKRCVQ